MFPDPRTDKRLVEIKYSFARAVKETDLRFHDFRHTAATRMGDAEADAFTLARSSVVQHSYGDALCDGGGVEESCDLRSGRVQLRI